LGVALGLGIGVAGVALLTLTRKRGWSAPGFRPLTVLGIALFAYSAAVLAGTNGFVAAFIAGMVFGTALPHRDELLGFAADAGTLMSLLMWFLFGAAILIPGLDNASWRDVLFALLVLTVARMLPTALALAGSGLDRATVAFIGWFGPRGLASVVFGLLAFDALLPNDARTVLSAMTVTVALSVLLHGVTASPLAARYGAYAQRLQPERPENRPATGPPLRSRAFRSESLPFRHRSTDQSTDQ
jgi:NhaP-type Na+/H+ or K+/H+ antiporter